MISFLAVLVLSFATLCLGTYFADRLEHADRASDRKTIAQPTAQ